jgi:hypothetical protein
VRAQLGGAREQFRFLSSQALSLVDSCSLRASSFSLSLSPCVAASLLSLLYHSEHTEGEDTHSNLLLLLAMEATARWVPPAGAEEEGEQQADQSLSTAAPAPPLRLCFPNTLAGGAKVPFVPLKPGRVTWYACGPTVYDSAHMVSTEREGEKRENS